jgi:hypothetical protein
VIFGGAKEFWSDFGCRLRRLAEVSGAG